MENMTGKSIVLRVATALLLAVVTAGCGSTRKAAKGQAAGEVSGWQTLRVPVSVRVESPRQFSYSSIRMSMERNRSVTYTIHFLGMEVGAIHITPDSLLAYSMPQRIYVAEDLASALNGVALPMADIQALLIGQALPDFDKLPAVSKNSSLTISAHTDPQTSMPESLTVTQANHSRSLLMHWTRESAPTMPFASALGLTLENAKGAPLKATITYSWGQATFDSASTRRFKLPTSYRRVDGRTLIESLITQ